MKFNNCLRSKMLIFAMVGLTGIVRANQHFLPVSNTGVLCWIIIRNVTIDGVQLQNEDEIGVFDGGVCVGAVVYAGTYPMSCSAILQFVSPNGDTLEGAKRGNTMVFKVFQKLSGMEINATPSLSSGGHFGDILTVVETLEASTGSPVKDKEDTGLPRDFGLVQNCPNPFNPSTTIQYQIPKTHWTRICIYDIMGHKVRTLVDDIIQAGIYKISWNGCDDRGSRVNSGPYFVRIQAGSYTNTKKMLLVN